jgi:hypothetical protein
MTPSRAAALQIELLAAFELTAAELSPSFGTTALEFRARDGRTRITLQPGTAHLGATFWTTEIILDRSGQIAEIALEAEPT